MTRTKWWLRAVGSFYLILAITSLWVLFVNPGLFGAMFPFAAEASTVRAFSDAWLIFVLEMAVIGAVMLYAARNPAGHRILVATVALLELVRGAGGDLLWMARGWPAANYIPFMLLHLTIALTGFWCLRRDASQPSRRAAGLPGASAE